MPTGLIRNTCLNFANLYPQDKFHIGNQSGKSQFTENCSITFMVFYHEDSNVAVSNDSFRSLIVNRKEWFMKSMTSIHELNA